MQTAICAFEVCFPPSRTTGKERDAESGNDYFMARYYSSSMGRFMSPDYDADDEDPEPVPYANLEDPQSLNLYSYVGNNPLSKTDSNGHFKCNCQPDPDYWKHQQEEAHRQWLMLMLMAYTAYQMEKQQMLHPYSIWNRPAAPPAAAPAQSTPADPNNNKRKYEKSDKHGRSKRGNVSKAPSDGQTALDDSVQVKDTSPRRVGVDPANKEIVVLDQTSDGVFHGHVREWNELTSQMQNALKDAGLTDASGGIK